MTGWLWMVWNWWISLFPNILNYWVRKANDITSGPSLVQMTPCGWDCGFECSWSQGFGPTKAAAELSGLRISLRKSWSRCSDSSLWDLQISRSQGLYRRKGSTRIVKADGLGPWERCRRCWDSRASSRSRSRDALTQSGDSGACGYRGVSLQERNFLFAFVNGGQVLTSCQQLRITNVPMMGTKRLVDGCLRQFTCHRAWLTCWLTPLSSQSSKAW